MTFTCLMALEDPLRDRVQKVTKYANKGNINLRLISGDHLDTVKAAAMDAGILDAAVVQNLSLDDEHRYAMDAHTFSDMVGEIEEDRMKMVTLPVDSATKKNSTNWLKLLKLLDAPILNTKNFLLLDCKL